MRSLNKSVTNMLTGSGNSRTLLIIIACLCALLFLTWSLLIYTLLHASRIHGQEQRSSVAIPEMNGYQRQLDDLKEQVRRQQRETTTLIQQPALSSSQFEKGGNVGWFEAIRRDREMDQSRAELRTRLPPNIWSDPASFHSAIHDSEFTEKVRELLRNDSEHPGQYEIVENLCSNVLFSTVLRAICPLGDRHESLHVSTGDIPEEWIRDSAVQIGPYLARVRKFPALRSIVEGAIRQAAFFQLQDVYANAFYSKYRPPQSMSDYELSLGRGGYVGTRNYELDSGAYYMHLIYNYFISPNIHKPQMLLSEPDIFSAINLLVDTWIIEQDHENKSTYNYPELVRSGKGPLAGYTGMSWTGHRPSDDRCRYSYHIPSNMFAVGALLRIIEINKLVWGSADLDDKATKLSNEMIQGLETYGKVRLSDGTMIYAYEVDGLGNTLHDFDDANVPSLLAMPLLGYDGYDKQAYQNTRARLLSPTNQFYYQGSEYTGIGSPHTPPQHIWPMAMVISALTDPSPEYTVLQLHQLVKSALTCGNSGTFHESVHKDGCQGSRMYTREWFEWANMLYVVLVEHSLNVSCDSHAQEWAAKKVGIPSKVSGPRFEAFFSSLVTQDCKPMPLPEPPKDVSSSGAIGSNSRLARRPRRRSGAQSAESL